MRLYGYRSGVQALGFGIPSLGPREDQETDVVSVLIGLVVGA